MTPMDAVFYNYALSSASYRVRIALNLKRLDPKSIVDVNLRAGAQNEEGYREVAPSGLVPALDFGTGAFSQSLALIEWLDDKCSEPRLIAEDPEQALAAREIAFSIACDIHPLNNLRILKYLRAQLAAPEEAVQSWYQHWVQSGFDGIEKRVLCYKNEGLFCLGADVGIADVCLVPQVFNSRRFDVDLTAYPRILSIFNHCQTLEAFKEAAPQSE